MKTGVKLSLGLGLGLGLALGAGGLALKHQAKLRTETSALYWKHLTAAQDISQVGLDLARYRQTEQATTTKVPAEEFASYVNTLAEYENSIEAGINRLRVLSTAPSDKRAFEVIDANWPDFKRRSDDIVELVNQKKYGQAEKRSQQNQSPVNAMQAALATLASTHKDAAKLAFVHLDEAQGAAKVQTLALLGLAGALGLCVGGLLIRNVSSSLEQIRQRSESLFGMCLPNIRNGVETLAKGEVETSVYTSTRPLALKSKDEFGDIAASVNGIIEQARLTADAIKGAQVFVREQQETMTAMRQVQSELKHEREEAENQLEQAQTELQEQRAARSTLEQEQITLQAEIEAAREEQEKVVATYEKRLAELQEEQEAAKASLEERENEMREQQEAAREAWRQEQDMTGGDIVLKQAELEKTLEADRAAMEQELAAIRSELDNANQALLLAHAELERQKAVNEALRQEQDALKQEQQTLRNGREATVNLLETKLAEMQERQDVGLSSLSETQAETIRQYRETIAELEAQKAELQRRQEATAEALQQTQTRLQGWMDRVIEAAEAMTKKATELSASVKQTGQTATDIAHAMQGVAQAVEESAEAAHHVVTENHRQSRSVLEAANAIERLHGAVATIQNGQSQQRDAIQQASTGMEDVAHSAEEVVNSARQAVEIAQEAAQAAESGGRSAEQTMASLERVWDQIAASALKVRELGEKGDAIGNVARTLEDLAEQTNVLAQNVADAAQAGETGGDLSHVSEMAKTLAGRSETISREISELMGSARADIEAAVSAMQSGSQEIAEGAAYGKETELALEQVMGKIQSVATEVERVGSTADEMTRIMQGALPYIQAVRDELAASQRAMFQMTSGAMQASDAILHASEQTELSVTAAGEINQATSRLSERTQEAAQMVETHCNALAAAGATDTELQQYATDMDALKDVSSSLLPVAQDSAEAEPETEIVAEAVPETFVASDELEIAASDDLETVAATEIVASAELEIVAETETEIATETETEIATEMEAEIVAEIEAEIVAEIVPVMAVAEESEVEIVAETEAVAPIEVEAVSSVEAIATSSFEAEPLVVAEAETEVEVIASIEIEADPIAVAEEPSQGASIEMISNALDIMMAEAAHGQPKPITEEEIAGLEPIADGDPYTIDIEEAPVPVLEIESVPFIEALEIPVIGEAVAEESAMLDLLAESETQPIEASWELETAQAAEPVAAVSALETSMELVAETEPAFIAEVGEAPLLSGEPELTPVAETELEITAQEGETAPEIVAEAVPETFVASDELEIAASDDLETVAATEIVASAELEIVAETETEIATETETEIATEMEAEIVAEIEAEIVAEIVPVMAVAEESEVEIVAETEAVAPIEVEAVSSVEAIATSSFEAEPLVVAEAETEVEVIASIEIEADPIAVAEHESDESTLNATIITQEPIALPEGLLAVEEEAPILLPEPLLAEQEETLPIVAAIQTEITAEKAEEPIAATAQDDEIPTIPADLLAAIIEGEPFPAIEEVVSAGEVEEPVAAHVDGVIEAEAALPVATFDTDVTFHAEATDASEEAMKVELQMVNTTETGMTTDVMSTEAENEVTTDVESISAELESATAQEIEGLIASLEEALPQMNIGNIYPEDEAGVLDPPSLRLAG